jgi:hypothetical protein
MRCDVREGTIIPSRRFGLVGQFLGHAAHSLIFTPGKCQKALSTLAGPLLAQSGHRAAEFQCPLLGVKRTLVGGAAMSAFDPKRTFAARFRQTMDRFNR